MKMFFEKLRFIAVIAGARCAQFFKELLCDHEWEPRYHSYRCPKCHKLDME